MGLFINTGQHPDVFGNQGSIEEPNQEYFKLDYFAELVKEQKRMNDSLLQSYKTLKQLFHELKSTQAREWREVGSQLKVLKDSNQHHQEFESRALEWLTMLDDTNQKLQMALENEGRHKQKIIDEIKQISQSNQEIVNQLSDYGTASKQLTVQLEELFDLQNEMSTQMSKQDDNQNKVLNRLDNQEALMEKTYRQVNHMRSILFERASFIAEKIENSYNLTSSYIYKLMTGSEQPLALFMTNQKGENSRENNK